MEILENVLLFGSGIIIAYLYMVTKVAKLAEQAAQKIAQQRLDEVMRHNEQVIRQVSKSTASQIIVELEAYYNYNRIDT